MYCVGIDPGWKNLGFALVGETETEKLRVVMKMSEDYSESTHEKVVNQLRSVYENGYIPSHVIIERYAPYNNTFSAETENITMLIGMIRFNWGTCVHRDNVILIRAIDWKTRLVKLLNKRYGFENPSNSLDKKFSLAAAKFIVDNPERIQNDHEADAVCLASLPILFRRIET